MPRLKISLPDDLRGENSGSERGSRALGAGIEGADDLSQHFDRWLSCWADGED